MVSSYMKDSEQILLTLEQKEAQVGAELRTHYEQLVASGEMMKNRTNFHGIVVDSRDTKFHEDGFYYEAVNVARTLVQQMKEKKEFNHFRIRLFFNDMSEALKGSPTLREEVLNNLIIPISKEDKKALFSFDEGVTRIANCITLVIDKRGDKLVQFEVTRSAFTSEKNTTFEKYTEENKKDPLFQQLLKAVNKFTCQQVKPTYFSDDPTQRMFTELMLLASNIAAKTADHNNCDNFIYRTEDHDKNPVYSFKPGFNAAHATSYFCDFTKPLTRLVAAPNALAYLAKIEKEHEKENKGFVASPNLITDQQYIDFVNKVNSEIAACKSRADARNLLSGDERQKNHPVNDYPIVSKKEYYNEIKSGVVYASYIKNGKDPEKVYYDKSIDLMPNDSYAIILTMPNSNEQYQLKSIVNATLKNKIYKAQKIFDDIIFDRPDIMHSSSVKTHYRKHDDGTLLTRYSCQLYTFKKDMLYTSERFDDVLDAKFALISQISYRRSEHINLKEEAKAEKNGYSRNEVILKTKTITERYKELGNQISEVDKEEGLSAKDKVLKLMMVNNWKVDDILSQTKDSRDRIKLKVKLTADIFTHSSSESAYGSAKEKEGLQEVVYGAVLDKLKHIASVIDGANRQKEQGGVVIRQ